jgi:hypothetical protein
MIRLMAFGERQSMVICGHNVCMNQKNVSKKCCSLTAAVLDSGSLGPCCYILKALLKIVFNCFWVFIYEWDIKVLGIEVEDKPVYHERPPRP